MKQDDTDNRCYGLYLKHVQPPVFATRGFANADTFYTELAKHSPKSERYRIILGLCHGTTIEHLEAARETLVLMRLVEKTPVELESAEVETPDGTIVSGVIFDIDPIAGRYSRFLRTIVTEACAALEALTYEFAFSFDCVPKKNDGSDDERQIGFYSPRVQSVMESKASTAQSVHLRRLHGYLLDAAAAPIFRELDTIRRVSYHRHLQFLQLEGKAAIVDMEAMTLMSTVPPPRFRRPDNLEDLVPTFEHDINPSDFLESVLNWLADIINEAYRLAAEALIEVHTDPQAMSEGGM